jgi:hypothetical protein
MRKILDQGCPTAVERLERDGFIVRNTILLTPKEDTGPLEGQRVHGGLVGFALVALMPVIDIRLEGILNRCSGPLHEGLAEECGALEAPVDPAFRATPFRHRDKAGKLLACGGGRIAVALHASSPQRAIGPRRDTGYPGRLPPRASRRLA